jgi:hypothetical protein
MLGLFLKKGINYELKAAIIKDKGWSKSFNVKGDRDEEIQFFLSE